MFMFMFALASLTRSTSVLTNLPYSPGWFTSDWDSVVVQMQPCQVQFNSQEQRVLCLAVTFLCLSCWPNYSSASAVEGFHFLLHSQMVAWVRNITRALLIRLSGKWVRFHFLSSCRACGKHDGSQFWMQEKKSNL